MPTAPPPTDSRSTRPRSPTRRPGRNPIDFFFRFDFFISYRWSDGRTYAVRLRDELLTRGFVVFLDSSDYAKGDNWREAGRRALARSSRLLLVASPQVFDSDPVQHEVEIFAGLGRRIMPIDIGGALASSDATGPLLQLLPPEILRFAEDGRDALSTGPSKEVVDDICRSFELIRQQLRRARMLGGVIVFLASLLVLAALLGLYANAKRRQATAESEAKEQQRLVAEGGRASAILDDPAEWSVGLSIAALNAFRAQSEHHSVPRALHLALLRGVWAATPYRVLSRDLSPSAQGYFLPDGRVITIAGEQKMIAVTDARTADMTVLPLRDPPKAIRQVALSPDGTKILVLAGMHSLRLWKIDGTFLRTIEAPDDFVVTSVFVGDDTVITAARSGAVRSWPLDSARPERLEWSVPEGIVKIALAPQGDRIAIADDGAPEPRLRIHTLATRGDLFVLPDGPVTRTTSLAFSPDGSRLVSGDEAGRVHLWNVHTGKQTSEIRVSDLPVSDAGFSPNGRRVAVGCFDRTVHVWDTARSHVQTLHGHLAPVGSVSFAPDGEHVLSASEDGTARLWEIDSHPGITVIDGRMQSMCGQAAPARGDRLALVGHDQRVHVFDAVSGRSLRELGEQGGDVLSASFSPDGTRIVTASPHEGVVVWDPQSGVRLNGRAEMSHVRSVAFAGGNDAVLLAGTNGIAGEWTIGGDVRPLAISNKQSVYAITSSRDGRLLATAGQGGGAQTWNADGSPRAQLDGNAVFGSSVCFARDSERLLTSGGDGIAYLWDLSHGTRELTLAGHSDAVATTTFSLDESLIYTSSDDHTVRIWEASSGAQVGRLVFGGAAHDAVELPPHRLAVTISDETWIGSTDIDDLLADACTIVRLGAIDRVSATEASELTQACDRGAVRSPAQATQR